MDFRGWTCEIFIAYYWRLTIRKIQAYGVNLQIYIFKEKCVHNESDLKAQDEEKKILWNVTFL